LLRLYPTMEPKTQDPFSYLGHLQEKDGHPKISELQQGTQILASSSSRRAGLAPLPSSGAAKRARLPLRRWPTPPPPAAELAAAALPPLRRRARRPRRRDLRPASSLPRLRRAAACGAAPLLPPPPSRPVGSAPAPRARQRPLPRQRSGVGRRGAELERRGDGGHGPLRPFHGGRRALPPSSPWRPASSVTAAPRRSLHRPRARPSPAAARGSSAAGPREARGGRAATAGGSGPPVCHGKPVRHGIGGATRPLAAAGAESAPSPIGACTRAAESVWCGRREQFQPSRILLLRRAGLPATTSARHFRGPELARQLDSPHGGGGRGRCGWWRPRKRRWNCVVRRGGRIFAFR